MPSFINLYSAPDLKAGADEALAYALDHLGYSQIYSLEFIRLALGYLNAAIAGALFFAERKYGWFELYNYILFAVIAHAVLTAAVFGWKRFVEKNAVYIGRSPAGATVYLRTRAPKNDNEYTIAVVGGGEVTTPFSAFFDHNGHVNHEVFRPLVQSVLPKPKKD